MMDIIKYSDSGGVEKFATDEDGGDGPSMEDIIMSMQEHLPGGTGGPGPESPFMETRAHSPHRRRSDASSRHMDETNRQGGVAWVRGDVTDSDTEVELGEEYPRLQTPFYDQLRKKYPTAFRRRSSLCSDTSSVVSLPAYRPKMALPSDIGDSDSCSVSGVPLNRHGGHHRTHRRLSAQGETDTPSGRIRQPTTPRGNRTPRETRTPRDNTDDRTSEIYPTEGGEEITPRGLPPKPPLNSGGKKECTKKSLPKPETLSQKNGVVQNGGCLNEWNTESDTCDKLPLQEDSVSLTSKSKPAKSQSKVDSGTLKNRLRKNQENLKQLLSEDFLPFKSKRNKGASHTARPVPDTQENIAKVSKNDNVPKFQFSIVSQSSNAAKRHQNLKQVQQMNGIVHKAKNDKHLPLSIHIEPNNEIQAIPRKTQQRVSERSMQNGHAPEITRRGRSEVQTVISAGGVKRFSSPDSQHDSAVDVDTGSVHSSPSSDTQTVITIKQKANINANDSGMESETKVDLTPVAPPRKSRTPKLGKFRKQTPQTNNLPIHNKTSEQDMDMSRSKLVQGGRPQRQDSLSSMEADVDMLRCDDERQRTGSRSGILSHSKAGPLRADHTLQPVSPRSPTYPGSSSDADIDPWNQHGARPKLHIPHSDGPRRAASACDLSRKRDSPSPRVHFEDEVIQNGMGDRIMSQPELWKQGVLNRNVQQKLVQDYDNVHVYDNAQRNHKDSQSGQVLHKKYSHSEQLLHTLGLSPGGRKDSSVQEIEKRVLKSRPRSVTPCELSETIFSDSDQDLESSMEIHRASPAIVLPPRKPLMVRTDSPTSEIELAHEVGYYNKLYEDINSHKVKRSKKPWKRNKGCYTPSEEVEKVQSLIMSRSSSTQSLVSQKSQKTKELSSSMAGRPPQSRKPPAGHKKPPLPPKLVSSAGALPGRTGQPVSSRHDGTPAGTDKDNPYEEIDVKSASMTEISHSSDKTLTPTPAIYTAIDPRKKSRGSESSNPCVISDHDESITEIEAPPIPSRGYTSDLERYKNNKEINGSLSSLASKVGSLRHSARKKFSKLRKAVSLDRMDKVGKDKETGGLKKAPSLRSLTDKLKLHKRRGSKAESESGGVARRNSQKPPKPQPSSIRLSKKHSASLTTLDTVQTPTHFRPIGKLRELNPDGTQTLELIKPPHGPFGFYIARGNAKFNHGIFISRLSDGLPGHFFAGLLSVGDEILEINGSPLGTMDLDNVYDLINARNRLLLKTLPFLSRSDS